METTLSQSTNHQIVRDTEDEMAKRRASSSINDYPSLPINHQIVQDVEADIADSKNSPNPETSGKTASKLMDAINSLCGKAETINVKMESLNRVKTGLSTSNPEFSSSGFNQAFPYTILGFTGVVGTICLSLLFMSPIVGFCTFFLAYASSAIMPENPNTQLSAVNTSRRRYKIGLAIAGALVIFLGILSQFVNTISIAYALISAFSLVVINLSGTEPLKYLIYSIITRWLDFNIARLERAYKASKPQAKIAKITRQMEPLVIDSKINLSPVPQFTNKYFIKFFESSPFTPSNPTQESPTLISDQNHTENLPEAESSDPDENESDYHRSLIEDRIRRDESEIS